MSGITVYLTTTKWTVATDIPNPDFFISMDIPVCCCTMLLGAFGFSPRENETTEHDWANLMLNMAKFVYVDTKNKTVYIGDDYRKLSW